MTTMAAKTHPGFTSIAPYPGAYVHALRDALHSLGWELDRWRGIAASIRRGEHSAMLEPEIPYRRLRHLPRERWTGVLTEWLRVLPQQLWPEGDIVGEPRIANPFIRSALNETITYAVLIPQDLALVVHRPDSCIMTDEAISRSGRAGADFFEAAVETVANRTTLESFRPVDEFGIVEAAVGDGLDACRVFLVEELFKDAPDGFFVSVPSRDRLLFLPVRRETLPAAPRLHQMTEQTFASAVHPVSNRLYWVKQGNWELFGFKREPGRIEIVPPEPFVEVLQRLLPDATGGPPALPSPPPGGSSEGEMPN
ncbi:MAG: hypothetical protein U0744_10140 [Gemmataceae bacterium]